MAAPKKVSFLVQTADPVAFVAMTTGQKLVFAHNYGQVPWQVNGNGEKDGKDYILVRGKHYDVGGDDNTTEITMKMDFTVAFYLRWVPPTAPVTEEVVDLTDGRLSVVNP